MRMAAIFLLILAGCAESPAEKKRRLLEEVAFLYPLDEHQFKVRSYRTINTELPWKSVGGDFLLDFNLDEGTDSEEEQISHVYENYYDLDGPCSGSYDASAELAGDLTQEEDGSWDVYDPYLPPTEPVQEERSGLDTGKRVYLVYPSDAGAILGERCHFTVYSENVVTLELYWNGDLKIGDANRGLEFWARPLGAPEPDYDDIAEDL